MEIPDFEPALHLSPYRLFRALAEGERPLLIDLRPGPVAETLLGARSGADVEGDLEGLELEGAPEEGCEATRGLAVVLFDDDGVGASATARRLQAAGHGAVRALYGGLELYRHCLDPRVVGEERYLRPPPKP